MSPWAQPPFSLFFHCFFFLIFLLCFFHILWRTRPLGGAQGYPMKHKVPSYGCNRSKGSFIQMHSWSTKCNRLCHWGTELYKTCCNNLTPNKIPGLIQYTKKKRSILFFLYTNVFSNRWQALSAQQYHISIIFLISNQGWKLNNLT